MFEKINRTRTLIKTNEIFQLANQKYCHIQVTQARKLTSEKRSYNLCSSDIKCARLKPSFQDFSTSFFTAKILR